MGISYKDILYIKSDGVNMDISIRNNKKAFIIRVLTPTSITSKKKWNLYSPINNTSSFH